MRFAPQWVPGARVLDLACGSGRHARALQALGARVTAVDRDAAALQRWPAGTEAITADLEGAPWPLVGRQFDAVIVTHYLWRPLWPHILQAVAPGGWLVYETFADDNASVGRPSRPDFLLRRGELLDVVAGTLRVVAYEDGFLADPDRFVQRIAAVRHTDTDAATSPQRFCL
jgi:SAM-dependent methyltransferase